MHSRIIQLETEPVREQDYIDEFSIPEWFEHGVADYVTVSNRKSDISLFKTAIIDPAEHAVMNNEGKLTIYDKRGFQEEYFAERFYNLKNEVAALTLDGFLDPLIAYRLTRDIKDRFGLYIYMKGELYPLDDFVRRLSMDPMDEATFYVGSTLDYHF